MKGLDISVHQKGIKLTDIKNAGYEFVILRGGYTGWGSNRSKNKDAQFETFYKQAKDIKMPVGCFYYSCANTYQGGVDEANYLYNQCLKGKQFEYPIYIDVEESRWQSKDKKGVTDAIIGFCETLENKGYWVGIYASLDWFKNKIQTDRLNAYTKWVAAWSSKKPDFKWNAFDLWQNSDNGKVKNYRVDTNISYKDFPTLIKNAGKNGFNKTSEKKEEPKKGEPNDKVYYTIKKGDTLTKIASTYKTTVEQLVKWNNIKNKNLIYPGQKIRVK